MPSFGSNATASWAYRPALLIGCRSDWPPAGTSKMKPCGCSSGTFEAPVKSGPTSGPLIVSSQVIQLPHGMMPPEQFIIVPFRLVKASTTSPDGLVTTVVVPPSALASYGVPGPNAVPGGCPGGGLLSS